LELSNTVLLLAKLLLESEKQKLEPCPEITYCPLRYPMQLAATSKLDWTS